MILRTTKTSLETVKENIVAHAKEHTFGVLHSYNFQQILETKGFPIEKEVSVYEICNPKGAQAILNNAPQMASYLPCRISVYEENGETVLGTVDFRELIDTLEIEAELKEHLHEIFKNIIALLESF